MLFKYMLFKYICVQNCISHPHLHLFQSSVFDSFKFVCCMSQECLERLFSGCGKVQNVYLHKKPSAGEPEKASDSYFSLTDGITVRVGHFVLANRSFAS